MKNEHREIAREKKKGKRRGGGGEMKNEMVKISAKVQA